MQAMSQINCGELVAFVHIPKSGGTTLSRLLAHQYASDEIYRIHQNGSSKQIRRFKAAIRQYRRSLRLVQGHFDLSLSKLLPSDTRFFTFLRDPVERAISHYHHYRRLTTDPIHPLAMQSSLLEWVSACDLTEMDNGQTRRLAGEVNLPCGAVSSQTLNQAKINLARKFAVVGLTERFEESQVLLHRTFSWPLYRYPASNVGENRQLRAEISEEVLKAIEDCNRFDLELYRYATELFEQAVSKIDMTRELALLEAAPVHVEPTRPLVQTKHSKVAYRSSISRLTTLFFKQYLPKLFIPLCCNTLMTLSYCNADNILFAQL